jgi:alkylation response protein AidB-like acyl-CoA dehydrogenase
MYVSMELVRSVASWATLVLADEPTRALEAASRAKLQVSRSGRHIGQEAIQLHGGIGMTAEYAVGHFTSRLTAINHWLGDADEQVRVLSGTLADHTVLDPLDA